MQGQEQARADSELPVTTKKKMEAKIGKIFRQFSFSTFTFHLFMLNCITWLAVHIVYWANHLQWDCVQLFFFAKFQPSITYDYQFWRLLLSSLMFRGGIQFYFNNFSLNMMGYIFEKESKFKFLLIFYGGILGGHMLSCCLSEPQMLAVGTSCGTIALLPTQICRFIRLRRTNPIQAESRLKFLVFNIVSNFVLNVLAIFHITEVDWVSHGGCIVAGLMFLGFFELKQLNKKRQFDKDFSIPKKTMVTVAQYGCLLAYFVFLLLMGVVIWVALPNWGTGKQQLQQMTSLCYNTNP